MLVAKLVPEIMERLIMGTKDYMAESGQPLLATELA